MEIDLGDSTEILKILGYYEDPEDPKDPQSDDSMVRVPPGVTSI